MMRICKHCKKELPETEEFFYIGKNHVGTYWLPNCRNCAYGNGILYKKEVKIEKECKKCKKIKRMDKFRAHRNTCKECGKEYWKLRSKKNKEIASTVEPKKTTVEPKNKEEKVIIEQSLNGLNGDLKAIKIYKKLSEKVCVLMRKNRIEKYGINAQNIIIELMEACYKHLDKEVNNKEVISIDWE